MSSVVSFTQQLRIRTTMKCNATIQSASQQNLFDAVIFKKVDFLLFFIFSETNSRLRTQTLKSLTSCFFALTRQKRMLWDNSSIIETEMKAKGMRSVKK